MTTQFLIGICISIVGSGIAAYVAVKVALAQIQATQRAHHDKIHSLDNRVERLESPYFKK